MAGPDLGLGREGEELLVEAAKDVACSFVLVDREIGPRDVADEQGVSGEHRPRLVATVGVDERKRSVLRAMPRRVNGADAERAELQLPPVLERLVGIVHVRRFVEVY
jgi:hypothetical protein